MHPYLRDAAGVPPAAAGTAELHGLVRELLNRHPSVGMAVGVVRDGALEFFHAQGFADLDRQTPITEDTVFRVASITKTFTAIAIMQLWEQGRVDLDAPAGDYLRAFTLRPVNRAHKAPTVRQLLTHTSGIPEELHLTDALKPLFGEVVGPDRPVPTLTQYYRDGLRIEAEPGTRFLYTDHNFTTLSQIVEDVSGQPFPDYVREHVFDPLGMTHSDLTCSERVAPRLAMGYRLTAHGPRPVPHRKVITVGGGGAYSTPRDMGRYLSALLSGGSNEHGSVLEPATLASMFRPQYQPDPRIGGMGLAFSRFQLDGHLAVEHEGVLPGFNAQIFLAPDDRAGVMAFTNGSARAMLWLPAETSHLLGRALGVREARIRTDVPEHPEIWGTLCGRYALSAGWTDVRARMMLGLGVEVLARGGHLVARVLSPIPALYRGFALHPDDDGDPTAFRVDLSAFGMGTVRVVFGRDPGAGSTLLHLEVMPLTLRRVSPKPETSPPAQ